MYNTTGCGCQNTTTCIPSNQECGINVELTCSESVCQVCSQVTYTCTITNNASETMNNAVLTLPIDNALALMPKTISVNGESYDDTTLDLVPLGNIAPGNSVDVVYTCTVMTCQRYIKHAAKVKFSCCQCFSKKTLCVCSNVNVLQVCCCCNN